MNIIFLDIDGVLNCDLFYRNRTKELTYPLSEMCPERIKWLNEVCTTSKAQIVLSSTWRHGRDIEEMRNIFKELGATFDLIDYTPSFSTKWAVRGNEIYAWIEQNSMNLFGIEYYNYKNYVIIDDDSDMLLWQQAHFFQTDTHSGLTPNICYKINRFFGGARFPNLKEK